MMRRIISLVLVTIIIISTPIGVMGQSSRSRVPVLVQQPAQSGTMSFRNAGQMNLTDQINPTQGGMRIPAGIGTARSMVSDEAVMMGSGYQVHVLGEVANPGTYYITASSRLSEAISRAGGVSESGTERKIELKRKGGEKIHVDLLRFKLFGRLEDNPYLMDNDIVFVPIGNNTVQIVGAISRQNTYKLNDEKTLFDVVNLAGGFSAATAMQGDIRVIRFEDGKKSVKEVPIDDVAMKDFAILNGDVIVVPDLVTKDTTFDYNVAAIPGSEIFYPSYEDRVFVLGGVDMPGAYNFSPYYSVDQYVSMAGGLSDRGAPKYKIMTINGKKHEAKGSDRINPGETLLVKEHWMSPDRWMTFVLSLASFGLSASATIIALDRR